MAGSQEKEEEGTNKEEEKGPLPITSPFLSDRPSLPGEIRLLRGKRERSSSSVATAGKIIRQSRAPSVYAYSANYYTTKTIFPCLDKVQRRGFQNSFFRQSVALL